MFIVEGRFGEIIKRFTCENAREALNRFYELSRQEFEEISATGSDGNKLDAGQLLKESRRLAL